MLLSSEAGEFNYVRKALHWLAKALGHSDKAFLSSEKALCSSEKALRTLEKASRSSEKAFLSLEKALQTFANLLQKLQIAWFLKKSPGTFQYVRPHGVSGDVPNLHDTYRCEPNVTLPN